LPKIRYESQVSKEETEITISEELAKPAAWSIKEAIDNFIKYSENKNLKPTTIKKYKSQTVLLLKWFETDGIKKMACEVDVDLLLDFLEESFEANKWSARTYNNYVDGVITLFTRLPKLERRRNKDIRYNIDLTYLEDK